MMARCIRLGLAVRQYPGALTSVGLRGYRTNTTGNDLTSKVLILLDGRRAGTGNVAKIMTKNVQRVEIIRGPASVQYGTAAVGGVVNVITRQGSGPISGFVEGTMGSWRYEEGSLGIQGEGNGLDFSAAGSRSTKENYQTAGGDPYSNTGYDEKEDLSVNVGYRFNPNHRVGVIYTNTSVDEAGSPSYLSQNDLFSYMDKSNYSVDAIYTGATETERFSWELRYFTGKDKDNYTSPLWSYVRNDITDRKGAQAQLSANLDIATITEILFRIGAGDAVRNGRMIYFPCNLTCRLASRTGYFISCLAASIYGDPSKEPIRVAFSQPLPRVLEMTLGATVGGIRASEITTGN